MLRKYFCTHEASIFWNNLAAGEVAWFIVCCCAAQSWPTQILNQYQLSIQPTKHNTLVSHHLPAPASALLHHINILWTQDSVFIPGTHNNSSRTEGGTSLTPGHHCIGILFEIFNFHGLTQQSAVSHSDRKLIFLLCFVWEKIIQVVDYAKYSTLNSVWLAQDPRQETLDKRNRHQQIISSS